VRRRQFTRWLKSAIARWAPKRLGVAPSEELLRWHRRQVFFPDPSVRPDLSTALGFFDPFNLMLYTQKRPAIAAENTDKVGELINKGKYVEAKAMVSNRVFLLNGAQRQHYLLQVTADIHERRHFHECFGTKFGFQRQLQIVADSHSFYRMLNVVKAGGTIKLPLMRWAEQPDAPEELKDYIKARRSHIEWLHYQDGTAPPAAIPGAPPQAATIMIFAIGGVQFLLPAVPRLIGRSADTAQPKFFPLGALAIMEGTAFTLQRAAGRTLLSGYYNDEIEKAVSRGYVDNDYWLNYTHVDRFLTHVLEKFYMGYQLVYSDIAMMAEDHEDDHTTHPGWRLWTIVNTARGLGLTYRRPEAEVNLDAYMQKITHALGWKSINRVANEELARSKKAIADLDAGADRDSFWPVLHKAMHGSHIYFMELRLRHPDVFASPHRYLSIVGQLIEPPVLRDGNQIRFHGLTVEDAAVFRQWFFFEHLQRQLLYSTRLPCAAEYLPHKCPGDPFSSWRWQPQDSCAFSKALEALGIPKLKLEFL
jgi:hypothetical protein